MGFEGSNNVNVDNVTLEENISGEIEVVDIPDDVVTTDKILDGAVDFDKLSADALSSVQNRSSWHSHAWNYNSIPTGSFGVTINTSYPYNMKFECTTQNTELVYKVFLKAGNYKVGCRSYKGTNQGILTVRLDTDVVGTLDLYAGGTHFIRTETESFNVPTSGFFDLKFKNETKNASSSAYNLLLTDFFIIEV